MRIIVVAYIALMSMVAQAETHIEWVGVTKSGHHLLHVYHNGNKFTFPVDEKDLKDPEALKIMMDDVVKQVKGQEYVRDTSETYTFQENQK